MVSFAGEHLGRALLKHSVDLIPPQEGNGKGFPQEVKFFHCLQVRKQYKMCNMFGKGANYFFQYDFSVKSQFSNPWHHLLFLPAILSYFRILTVTRPKQHSCLFFFSNSL